jgi:hypothetical protein
MASNEYEHQKFESTIIDGKVINGYLCYLSNNDNEDCEETTNLALRELQKKHKREKNILLAAIHSLEHDQLTSQHIKQQKDKEFLKDFRQTLGHHSHFSCLKQSLDQCKDYIMRLFVSKIEDDKTKDDAKKKLDCFLLGHSDKCGGMIKNQELQIFLDISDYLKTSKISSNCEKSPSPNCSKVHSAFNDLATYLFKRNEQKLKDLYSVLNETNISYKAGKVVERQIDELINDVPIDIEKESFENKSFNPLQLLKTFDGQIAEISEKLNEF